MPTIFLPSAPPGDVGTVNLFFGSVVIVPGVLIVLNEIVIIEIG